MGCSASKQATTAIDDFTKESSPPSSTLQPPNHHQEVVKPTGYPFAVEQPVETAQNAFGPGRTRTQSQDTDDDVDVKIIENPPARLVAEPSLGFASIVAVGCGACALDQSDEDDDDDDDDDSSSDQRHHEKTQPQVESKQQKRPPVRRPPSDGNVKTPAGPPDRNQTSGTKNKDPPGDTHSTQPAPAAPPLPPKPKQPKKKKTKPKEKKSNAFLDGTHHLRNIFAKPFSIVDVASFLAPKFEKSESEKTFLKKALAKNFIFSTLTERQMKTIIDAFERQKYKYGDGPIIHQGDDGDYFYVIRRGMLHYEVDGIFVGNASAGQTFGELALIYTSPRAASVIPDSDCVLYRVDQSTFRYILQTHTEQTERDKRALLEGIPFLKDLDSTDLDKLAAAMAPRKFVRGENIARKGAPATAFYVLQEGKVQVRDLEIGGRSFENHDLSPGAFFGESTLLDSAPREAHFVGKTDGFALSIDKETFTEVLGHYEKLILKGADKKRLSGIHIIQNSFLSEATLSALAASVVERKFMPGGAVIAEDVYTPAAIYLVRSGRIELTVKAGGAKDFPRIIDKGGYFGEEMMLLDRDGVKRSPMVIANYTATAVGGPATLAVLTLEACRGITDTTVLGMGQRVDFTSIVDSDIPLNALKRHTILGAGTFGQVWLVSKVAPDKTNRPYALKIQSKFELVKNDQAIGVVSERNIMARLNHPFLLKLVETYKDETFVYMLLGLVQGGELYTVIHKRNRGGMSERDCRFYAACIFEGLAYMHRRQIVYRDLKPENVLIGFQGYPVIVDFGFAKQIQKKTYTLCGTPLYIAPEVVLNQGHDYACDHWSWAVLIFEMLTGYTPFHKKGMDQISLFKSVASGVYEFPTDGKVPHDAKDLIRRVLVLNQRKRLGSLAGGVDDVFAHKWFQDIDFGALRRKEVEAPWLPEIKDPLDASKFQQWDHLKDMTKRRFPPLSAKAHQMFNDF